MSKENSKLKLSDVSEESLLKLLQEKELIELPKQMEIIKVQTGVIEENQFNWCALECANKEELDKLKTIGLESRYTPLKVRVKGYRGQDLKWLEGKVLDLNNLTLEFSKTRTTKNINGLQFKLEFSALESSIKR